MVPFSFAGEEMALVEGRAVFWRREAALLVADLHLEKASFFAAASAQMLPPYDSRETLERLALAIRATGARRVFALGDSFHDREGAGRIDGHVAGMLGALTRAVSWTWIAGNHDGLSADGLGGECVEEAEVAGLVLRHRACADAAAPELSGHFHPRLAVTARGRRIARPCAVIGEGANPAESRLILPAFGALTGGMNAADPAILAAMQPARAIDALLPARGRLVRFPLWRTGGTLPT
jgi:DNA ligase-associated metallophosphoesterase